MIGNPFILILKRTKKTTTSETKNKLQSVIYSVFNFEAARSAVNEMKALCLKRAHF